jgi:hypothetical protein
MRVKWPQHEAGHLLPFTVEVKNVGRFTFIPLHTMAQCLSTERTVLFLIISKDKTTTVNKNLLEMSCDKESISILDMAIT